MKIPRTIPTQAGVIPQTVTLAFSDTKLRIAGIVLTNKTDISFALYYGKKYVAGANPDDQILPNELASIPVADLEAVTIAALGTPGRAGTLNVLATTEQVPAFRGNSNQSGSNVYPVRVNWPGGAQAQLVALPFGANSVRVWAKAGSCYLFTNSNVVVPIVFDNNSLPADVSFIGAVNQGGSDIFPLPAGTAQLLFIWYGGNAVNQFRASFGANNLWPLDDIYGTTARNLIGSAVGAYRATQLAVQQPPIFSDNSNSAECTGGAGGQSYGTPAMISEQSEPNAGSDYSVEFEYIPNSIQTFQTQSICNMEDPAKTTGFRLVQTGSGNLAFVVNGPGSYNQNGVFAAGSKYHIVMTFSVTQKLYTLYVNGASLGTVGGAVYNPTTGKLSIGGDNETGGQTNAPGYYQSLTTYPSVLTLQMVQKLYNALEGPGALSPEVLAFFTDANWSPVSSKIP